MSESRVRGIYANATAWNFGDHEDRPDLARMRETQYAEFDRFINKVKADARAEGVRETARYIERIAPKGLVDRSGVLADMGIAAERLEHGIHANGRDRIEGEA